jgi:membrane protease YdiL (CAAX protease family)
MASSSSVPGVISVLYVYLAAAFTLMVTVFHHRTLVRKHGDYRAFVLYFAAFFSLFLAVPLVIIALAVSSPGSFLAAVGLTAGRAGKGLLLTAAAIPVVLIGSFVSSRDPVMKDQYPFSKEACASLKKFVIYEALYLVLYYLPWEFLFRGILFFPMVQAAGLIPALGLQTILSTVYHLGHPRSEIFAALGAGFILGLIAYGTGSILYPFLIHALAGIANDSFLYHRYHGPDQAA